MRTLRLKTSSHFKPQYQAKKRQPCDLEDHQTTIMLRRVKSLLTAPEDQEKVSQVIKVTTIAPITLSANPSLAISRMVS